MAVVKLFSRDFGGAGKPPLIILHGLLGSSRNWQTVGRELAAHYHVRALDLRNHGASPWAEGMDYPSLAGDVAAWMDGAGIHTAHLLGHSMGGKTAMRFAADRPERLLSLTVVDIAPRPYDRHHRIEFDAMLGMDPATLTDRKEAEALLAAGGVSDWGMRQFLMTNLSRREEGGFAWDINVRELAANLPVVCANPLGEGETYAGPALFVIGGKSDFVSARDRLEIPRYFPNVRLADLPGSGHNPHIEDRSAFTRALVDATS